MAKLGEKNFEIEVGLQKLSIREKPNRDDGDISNADDGYNSCNSEEKEVTEDLEYENILEPLSIRAECQPVVHLLYNARGLQDHRYSPYTRTQSVISRTPVSVPRPSPILRILRVSDKSKPSILDTGVRWTSRQEITIPQCMLPPDTYYGPSPGHQLQIFIQINPELSEMKSFTADVRVEGEKHYIGPIVILLKTELAESQEKKLLELTTMEDRTTAYNLVANKNMEELTSGIGPHRDTILAMLCAQRNPEHPGKLYAQIHAVIQRLNSQPEQRGIQTIFNLNRNGISAFEISAITNNSVVACYLAELMYNFTDDADLALDNLLCKDSHGNTIIHLLARKGDSNKKTLKALLNLSLSDGSKMFRMVPNKRQQYPIHIAAQSAQNQPECVRLLYERLPGSAECPDSQGMTALHYAAQRTADVQLVQTILSYVKDNINVRCKAGLTALDLVTMRTQAGPVFPIEPAQQQHIIKLLRNNGGVSGRHGIDITHSSPGSDSLGSPLSTISSQPSPQQEYEDLLASEILTQFPAISDVLGQILGEEK